MSSIFVEYCGSWGYGPTARQLQKALEQGCNVKVDAQPANGKTGKIEASWVVNGVSNNYFDVESKVWSGGRDETGQKIPQIVEMMKNNQKAWWGTPVVIQINEGLASNRKAG
jgi:hypothetical protein